MARMNKERRITGSFASGDTDARIESLRQLGVDPITTMAELACGPKRACAEAERRLGVRWQQAGQCHAKGER